MCVVSMIVDHFGDKWGRWVPNPMDPYMPQPMSPLVPVPAVPIPIPAPVSPIAAPRQPSTPQITPEELAEFRRLLERAREYDKRNNEPDCELESKKARLRKIADDLGVKIDFL